MRRLLLPLLLLAAWPAWADVTLKGPITFDTTFTVSGSHVGVTTMTATTGGLVPTPPNDSTQVLLGDGTFGAVPGGSIPTADLLGGAAGSFASVAVGTGLSLSAGSLKLGDLSAVANNFVTSIVSGAPQLARPACGDLSNAGTGCSANPPTGSGTSGLIAQWNGSTSLTNSTITAGGFGYTAPNGTGAVAASGVGFRGGAGTNAAFPDGGGFSAFGGNSINSGAGGAGGVVTLVAGASFAHAGTPATLRGGDVVAGSGNFDGGQARVIPGTKNGTGIVGTIQLFKDNGSNATVAGLPTSCTGLPTGSLIASTVATIPLVVQLCP